MISRRRLLRALGLGTGAVAATGTGVLAWSAVDGGVFATGTGSAYTAWDSWDPQGTGAQGLVAAAVLAANAHNTQPWLFQVAPDRIDLFADPTRTIGAMDPLRREMHLSLGCALENLALAAPPRGLAPTVTLFPDPADQTCVARVDLVPTPAVASRLVPAIAARHTNRARYDTSRPVGRTDLDGLASLVDGDATLIWLVTDPQRAAFGDLTVRATRAIIADPQQAAADFAWYRMDWHELQAHQDGITIDASGQSELIRAASKVLPVSRAQNHDGWLRSTTKTQVPTAAAFGVLTVPDPVDPRAYLAAGRCWQRVQLAATLRGLATQPLCQVLERGDRERSAGLPQRFTTDLSDLLPAGRQAVLTFRIGHPTAAALRSPRRAAAKVLRANE